MPERSFRDDVLEHVLQGSGRALSEAEARHDRFAALPPELFEFAELQAGKDAPYVEKLKAAASLLREVLKLATAAAAKADASEAPKPSVKNSTKKTPDFGGATASELSDLITSFADATPDVMLAKAAEAIQLAEGVDLSAALDIAMKRDPATAERYARRHDSGSSDGWCLAEDSGIKPPPGMRLVTRRADVELSEVASRIARSRGVPLGQAVDLAMSEDPALASRYRDHQCGRTALQEAEYRAHTIREANRYRMTATKALACALAEDPALRRGVDAYFERAR